MNNLYRDDDVSVYTDICLFKELHNKFIEKRQKHTAAVIMKDLWNNQAIFYYLATAPYLEVGLHGWEHKDYSTLSYEECYNDLEKSLVYWRKNSVRMTKQCKEITTFFAPWNREGDNIKKACSNIGLKFCNVKKGKWDNFNIKSFHWWSIDENFKL